MNASSYIDLLISYAIEKNLIEEEDITYIRNSLLDVMGMDEYEPDSSVDEYDSLPPLEYILNGLIEQALKTGALSSDDIVSRDLFDTRLMGVLTPRPSEIIYTFREIYKENKEEATDWFYGFCQEVDYIRSYRVSKDKRWKVDSDYGEIDITINLSKPEKDPKAIANALKATQSGYPKCLLCMENEGYAGRINHPARQNHRIIPIEICGAHWGFQYSPYVYYNEHCIVFNGEHTPMKIDRSAFSKLFSFVEQFPHYFLGSNADLPIVGGSILTHDHFQGGRYTFAMEEADIVKTVEFPGFADIKAGIVKWPLSVIRLTGKDKDRIIDLAEIILNAWRGYTDEDSFIFAETDGVPHNTITPIARRRGELFELDLTLRNNITTDEHPSGVYHPHEELHHIKKENIGLIEVMGLAVLPRRLLSEMELLKPCLVQGGGIDDYEELKKHKDWACQIMEKYSDINEENVDSIIEEEIGSVFVKVLECAGVYKQTPEGIEGFLRFIDSVNQK